MSDTPISLSTILGALGTNVRNELVRAKNTRSVTASILRKQPAIGKNVTWDVNTTGAVAEGYSDADAVTNFGSNAVIQPTLSWGLRRSNWRVGDVAMRVAYAQGANPEWATKLDLKALKDAITELAADINSQVYAGNGSSPQLAGLAIAMSASNTYAGIDRTQGANALFRANVIDPGILTAPTLDLIRKDIGDTVYSAAGEQPDMAFCSPAVFYKIGSLFQEIRRVNQDVLTRGDGKQITLDASIGTLVFEGCTFIKDKDATANAIYYINSAHVWLEYLPATGAPDFTAEMGNDGYDDLMLSMGVAKLGKRSASTDFTLDSNLQLVVSRPNACGVRLNVAT